MYRPKADLPSDHRIHTGTERTSDELAAQTYAEGWSAGGQSPCEKHKLLAKERVLTLLVSADRTPEYAQEIRCQRVDLRKSLDPHVAISEIISMVLEYRRERAEILEMDVPKRKHGP
jgi:hypothetical protein